MKRDMELIRRILFKIEEMNGGSLRATYFSDVDARVVEHHFRLLDDSGFLLPLPAAPRSHPNNPNPNRSRVRSPSTGCFIQDPQLSSKGHDFLDAIRNDTIWSKVKEQLQNSVTSTTLETIKALAVSIGAKMLGI